MFVRGLNLRIDCRHFLRKNKFLHILRSVNLKLSECAYAVGWFLSVPVLREQLYKGLLMRSKDFQINTNFSCWYTLVSLVVLFWTGYRKTKTVLLASCAWVTSTALCSIACCEYKGSLRTEFSFSAYTQCFQITHQRWLLKIINTLALHKDFGIVSGFHCFFCEPCLKGSWSGLRIWSPVFVFAISHCFSWL